MEESTVYGNMRKSVFHAWIMIIFIKRNTRILAAAFSFYIFPLQRKPWKCECTFFEFDTVVQVSGPAIGAGGTGFEPFGSKRTNFSSSFVMQVVQGTSSSGIPLLSASPKSNGSFCAVIVVVVVAVVVVLVWRRFDVLARGFDGERVVGRCLIATCLFTWCVVKTFIDFAGGVVSCERLLVLFQLSAIFWLHFFC